MNIQYCFYHLTQSIWRKIQSLGLTNLYEADDDFRLFCGQIDALAFLPFDDVTEGMNQLRNSAPDEAASLLDYFDASYVTGQLRPLAHGVPADGIRLNFRRIAPIFSTRQWNMHDVNLANQPGTNNDSKGWDNKFHAFDGHNHPTVWKRVDCIQDVCGRVCGILLQDERGIRSKRRTNMCMWNFRSDSTVCVRTGPLGVRPFLNSSNLRGGQHNI